MSVKTTTAATTAQTPAHTTLKTIRRKCLECSSGSADAVRACYIPECPLYPFRFGRNPFKPPLSEKKRKAITANLKKAQATQRGNTLTTTAGGAENL